MTDKKEQQSTQSSTKQEFTPLFVSLTEQEQQTISGGGCRSRRSRAW